MAARAVMTGPAHLSPKFGRKSVAWRLVVGGLNGAWSVVTGICAALGTVLLVVCAIIEAMAVVFLLGSMGGKR